MLGLKLNHVSKRVPDVTIYGNPWCLRYCDHLLKAEFSRPRTLPALSDVWERPLNVISHSLIWHQYVQLCFIFISPSVCDQSACLQWQTPTQMNTSFIHWVYYTPRFNEVEKGYTGFTLSVRPSVDRIVSALYLQQYSADPFHICTSRQATSEGVSGVKFVSKVKNL